MDYDLNENTFEVSNFRCYLADFGAAGGPIYGGTPLYAGPRAFENSLKDLFSIGRMAMEFFLDPQGKNQLLKKLMTLTTQ